MTFTSSWLQLVNLISMSSSDGRFFFCCFFLSDGSGGHPCNSERMGGVRDADRQRESGAVLWLAAGPVGHVPVSSGSCAVRAVRRSSPNGHHLPLNNVRAILRGSQSHPDSRTQPAGLILTSKGTSMCSFQKRSYPTCDCHASYGVI